MDKYNEYTQVTTLDELKGLIKEKGENETHECFIQTNCGRSWKAISYNPNVEKPWFVLNEVDESEQNLTDDELFDNNISHIGDAINKGAFYYAWC